MIVLGSLRFLIGYLVVWLWVFEWYLSWVLCRMVVCWIAFLSFDWVWSWVLHVWIGSCVYMPILVFVDLHWMLVLGVLYLVWLVRIVCAFDLIWLSCCLLVRYWYLVVCLLWPFMGLIWVAGCLITLNVSVFVLFSFIVLYLFDMLDLEIAYVALCLHLLEDIYYIVWLLLFCLISL